MDIIADILDSVWLSGSLFFRANLNGDWGVLYEPTPSPVFHYIVAGEAWVARQRDHDYVHCQAGDVVFFPHGNAHVIAHSPNEQRLPRACIKPEDGCQTTRISDADASVRLMCGVFRSRTPLSHPLFATLPDFILMRPERRDGEWLPHAAQNLDQAVESARLGTGALRDRMFELLFVQLLQSQSNSSCSTYARFSAAVQDPAMRRILTEIHQAPGRAWRVDELATLAHCSRSVFTAKFRRQIGTSPMAYINHWRLHKAHALLVETAYPIYTVSDLIGYANTSSFIKAFRRKFGATPMGVRERAQSVSD